MVSSPSCTRKRKRDDDCSEVEDYNEGVTPWVCSIATTGHSHYNSLQPPSDLVQNPQCTDEEKSKLKRKGDHSSELEENDDDDTPWGCKTGMSLYDNPWKLKKVLAATDIQSHHNRLLLPSNVVQNLVCPILTKDEKSKLDSGEGTEIKFCDVNNTPNPSLHSLVLKKWASSGRSVLIGNWTNDFVKGKGLKKGEEIGVQWHKSNRTSTSLFLIPIKP